MTRRRLAGAISTIAVVAAALPSAASSAPGDVYVSEQDNPSNGALIRVNPVNGARSILTETTNTMGASNINKHYMVALTQGLGWPGNDFQPGITPLPAQTLMLRPGL